MTLLPTDIDASYGDSATDASVALHQQHHDIIHTAVNGLAGTFAARAAGTTDDAAALPFFNVKDFGAAGNGVADDTEAIQAALDAAATSTYSSRVVLPPGDYRTVASLIIDADGVVVAGAGSQATQIVTTSATADVFILGNGATTRNYMQVRDLRISSVIPRTAGAAINLNNVSHSYFDNVNLHAQFTGYQQQSGADNHIRGGTWDSPAANGVSLLIQGGNDLFVSDIVHDTLGTQPRAAIEATACGGSLVVANCDFLHAGYGLLLDPGDGQTVNWLFFHDVQFDFCSNNGIRIAPTGTGVVKGITFMDCWTSSCTGAGISLSNSSNIDGVVFIGHHSNSNGLQGAFVNGGKNVTFLGCTMAGNSEPENGGTIGAADGIMIQNGAGPFTITGCRIGPVEGAGNNQRYAVFINAGASDYYLITDNDLHGNLTGAINDGGTGTNKVIARNLGFNPRGHAVTQPAVPASTAAVTNGTGIDCTVFVAGGTVTAVGIGGSATGLTSGAFRVPAGQTIAITYSVAPTWQWFGD